MESFENFYKIFSVNTSQFWKKINKETLCPIEQDYNKRELLRDLHSSIVEKTYYPEKPRSYIIFNKGNSISRIVPVFTPRDTCVYFYCIKKLENYISGNRAPGTYGGWKLGGQIRTQEREEIEYYNQTFKSYEMPNGDIVTLDMSEEYPMETSFNPNAWRAAWGEFTNNVYVHSCKANKHNYVLEMDIANFYDSIRLDVLEDKIRGICPSEQNDVISLLFHFLKFWNRDYNFYSQQSVGIPQDEIADCSRILANFYLQDYDHQMLAICERYQAKYLRFADDQIIFAKSKNDLAEIAYLASLSLTQYGLCINQKKVDIKDKKDFEQYMAFQWHLLLSERNHLIVDDAIDFLLENKEGLKNDGSSLMIRLLNLITSKNQHEKVKKLFYEFLKPKFIQSQKIKAWHLEKIYNNLNNRERIKFINFLNKLSDELIHNNYHYTLLKFYKKLNLNCTHIEKRLVYLKTNFYPKQYIR
ncbi:MAG: RNA-directed DNA polymerase [Patescibacteria group bacterium]|nr:RNA-directed DNA polymerase [Patescibacteria group bacterium]MDD4611042.1 RNA-directed DNA polymerase [Patescibacteria group bacterium]